MTANDAAESVSQAYLLHVRNFAVNPDEAQYLSHRLNLALRSSCVDLVSYDAVTNPRLEQEFRDEVDKLEQAEVKLRQEAPLGAEVAGIPLSPLVVESLVDMSSAGLGTPEKIARNGFDVHSTRGMQFRVGNISSASVSSAACPSHQHCFCLCDVAVGRSFYVPKELRNGDSPGEAGNLPRGFSSILVEAPKEERSSDGEAAGDCSAMYLVFDRKLVRPKYFVTFNFDPDEELAGPVCGNCSSRNPTVYCEECKANLCSLCDDKLHDQPLTRSHPRGRPRRVDVRPCPFHPGVSASHYCKICAVPVCLECKMRGTHSTGAAQRHPLVTIDEQHASIERECQMDSARLQGKLGLLRQEIEKLSDRMREVRENQETLENEILHRATTAFLQLRQNVAYHEGVLKADLAELERQRQEILQFKALRQMHCQDSSAVRLITAWPQFCRTAEALEDDSRVRRKDDVRGNLKIVGHCRVEVLGEGETPDDYDDSSHPGTPRSPYHIPRVPHGAPPPQEPSTTFRRLAFEFLAPVEEFINVDPTRDIVESSFTRLRQGLPPLLAAKVDGELGQRPVRSTFRADGEPHFATQTGDV